MAAPDRRDQIRHRLASWERPVTLRLADAADLPALERLAELDSRALPPGPHLLGEREQGIEAAVSLSTGELVADPFRRTAELGELLRCHRGGVRVPAEQRSASRRPQPHPSPVT
ncbi:MAG TPA: hypothetical protein VFL56_01160, partial [Solirubrobacterales bacterium]|nr:hypothetical protein [Solirubrobacterales bacterium]